jgi:hypothetical protein
VGEGGDEERYDESERAAHRGRVARAREQVNVSAQEPSIVRQGSLAEEEGGSVLKLR